MSPLLSSVENFVKSITIILQSKHAPVNRKGRQARDLCSVKQILGNFDDLAILEIHTRHATVDVAEDFVRDGWDAVNDFFDGDAVVAPGCR